MRQQSDTQSLFSRAKNIKWSNKRNKLKSHLGEWKEGKVINFEVPMFIGCVVASLLFVSCESKASSIPSKVATSPEVTVPFYNDLSGKQLSTQTCLAVNSYFEGRSESDIANLAIMTTVYKRSLLGGRYGDSMCEAVFKPDAYSWTSDGLSDRIYNKEQYVRLYSLAERFLLNKDQYLLDFESIDHYVKVGHKTSWNYRMLDYIGRIDEHLFYRHK